jgi:hypothetical protein
MSAGSVGFGALLGTLAIGLPLGCGERAGDPVVRLATEPGDGGTGMAASAGAAGNDASGDPNGAGGASNRVGAIGLCGSCSSSDECGDANDACIRHFDQNFCGRDCDDQHRCPDGYACVELDNSQLWQCVPQNDCPTPEAVPALADVRQYLLARINAERVAQGTSPLDASSCLDELAQGSALAYARTDEPFGTYVKECDPIWPDGECGWSAEAEATVARYGLDWTTAVERALGTNRDTQGDRVVQAFLDDDARDVGIGFWLSGDEAWIALAFR